MMDNQELRKQLLQNWGNSSKEEAAAYSSLLDHVFSEPSENMKHMAFSSFSRIVKNPEIKNETLVNLVFHLINIAELLDLNYEFIDDEDNCYKISVEAIKEAQKTGVFSHPETGEEISSYEKEVFMYFTPSEKLLSLKESLPFEGAEK